MRNRQPKFPVHLPQLHRCELFTKQLVEELRELSRGADEAVLSEIEEIRSYAVAARDLVDMLARKVRPVGWSSPMQQRAEVRRKIRERRGR